MNETNCEFASYWDHRIAPHTLKCEGEVKFRGTADGYDAWTICSAHYGLLIGCRVWER